MSFSKGAFKMLSKLVIFFENKSLAYAMCFMFHDRKYCIFMPYKSQKKTAVTITN